MDKKITYRFLEKNDLRPLLALLLEHYKEVLPSFSPYLDFESSYENSIQLNKDLKVIVIDICNNLEGFLIFLHRQHPIYDRKDVIIREIHVSKNYRDSDIASKCVGYLISIYKNDNIFVDLQYDDVKADNFWKKNNFSPYQQRYKLSN